MKLTASRRTHVISRGVSAKFAFKNATFGAKFHKNVLSPCSSHQAEIYQLLSLLQSDLIQVLSVVCFIVVLKKSLHRNWTHMKAELQSKKIQSRFAHFMFLQAF